VETAKGDALQKQDGDDHGQPEKGQVEESRCPRLSRKSVLKPFCCSPIMYAWVNGIEPLQASQFAFPAKVIPALNPWDYQSLNLFPAIGSQTWKVPVS